MSVRLETDFHDFYDIAKDDESPVVYKRYCSNLYNRVMVVKYLKNLGLETFDIKQVIDQPFNVRDVVVFTDTVGHHGNGKIVLSRMEANENYSTFPSIPWVKKDDGKSIKFIQVGKRRFLFEFSNCGESLSMGNIVAFREIDNRYNMVIKEPIYSVDYVVFNNRWIATDFNCVECLGNYGISQIMAPQDVMDEIRESLIIYGRI